MKSEFITGYHNYTLSYFVHLLNSSNCFLYVSHLNTPSIQD